MGLREEKARESARKREREESDKTIGQRHERVKLTKQERMRQTPQRSYTRIRPFKPRIRQGQKRKQ